jgi:homoserine O-acetyltransferase/O-succinyltransferase
MGGLERIGRVEAFQKGDRMKLIRLFSSLALGVAVLGAPPARAADFPAPKEGDWVAKNFRFHTGESLPEVRIHYRTVGAPSGAPVLVLHGTGGSGANMLSKDFAGELFGPGQPLDAARYFIILPDAIGTGKSTRPSDGLRARFPKYNYDDMVLGQYRLVTEGLGLKHLRLVIGNSMGGMQTWIWGEKYPGFMDALVPMACQPVQMLGRNWMLRRLLTEAIRNDPDWNGGNYTAQPRAMQRLLVQFGIATSGGSQAYYAQAPTREKADAIVAQRLAQSFRGDANDVLFQWESSADYDPSPALERIEAALLAINSADDERNPPELGIMERELKRVKNGQLHLIPASAETRGHGTTGLAKFYARELAELLERAPRKTK